MRNISHYGHTSLEEKYLVNRWREIPPEDRPPEIVNAVIEVISGSRDKYKYHEEWDIFVLDRVLHARAWSTDLSHKPGLMTTVP